VQYITTIFTHLISKLYTAKTYDIYKAQIILKTRISYICSTTELSERHFCDVLEMKFTPPLGGAQRAGVPETAAKWVTHYLHLRLAITSG